MTVPVVENASDAKIKLRCSDTKAEHWLQPCTYSRRDQNLLIRKSLDCAREHLERWSSGPFEGPWTRSIAAGCARDIAQVLLGFAVAFKDPRFKEEQEWRFVCYPKFSLLSTASKMADEDFGICIKPVPMRHVELRIPLTIEQMMQPHLAHELPYTGVTQNPRKRVIAERESLNDLLNKSGNPGLLCR